MQRYRGTVNKGCLCSLGKPRDHNRRHTGAMMPRRISQRPHAMPADREAHLVMLMTCRQQSEGSAEAHLSPTSNTLETSKLFS